MEVDSCFVMKQPFSLSLHVCNLGLKTSYLGVVVHEVLVAEGNHFPHTKRTVRRGTIQVEINVYSWLE